jgi:hypothetical protein
MSTALDRIVPEDKKGEGLYRHDAEGSDDMPVSDNWGGGNWNAKVWDGMKANEGDRHTSSPH